MAHPRAHRPGPGRRLSGAPGARLPGRLHACRRCCGANCPGARSAGRVQSVALRLVCDRELEIEKFVRQEYWSLVATLATPRQRDVRGAPGRRRRQKAAAARHRLGRRSGSFQAGARNRRLHRRVGRSEAGQAASVAAVHHLNAAAGSKPQARFRAGAHHARGAAALRRHRYRRRDGRPDHLYAYRRRADRRGSDQRGAPRDRDRLRRADTCRPSPRRYETKAKNAQEAHEAIRPTELSRRPRDTKSFLDADQAKLYELIWLRTVASQMELAELERTTVDITAKVAGRLLELRATGTVVKFDGFLDALSGRAATKIRTTRSRAGCRR